MGSRVDQQVEVVSGAIHSWLLDEVASSSADRNQYLDDYVSWREQIKYRYDDPRNLTVAKNQAHLDRLPVWWQAYEIDPLQDEACAKISFAGLMFISGAFRNQSRFQARDAEDYQTRRKAGIGIDIESAVSTRLHTHLPRTANFANAKITMETLNNRRKQSERVTELAVKAICARAVYGYDVGQEHSRSVNEVKQDQYAWVTFVADCITLAAKQRRGELVAVPFLHPINISDNPGVIYPFTEAA